MDIAGFTGTQTGLTPAQAEALRRWFRRHDEVTTLIHGDCIGADAEAHKIAQEFGIRCLKYPGDNPAKRANTDAQALAEPQDNLKRNRLIVENCDILVACPKEDHEVQRSGTWATIRAAIRVHCPVDIIFKSGSLSIRR